MKLRILLSGGMTTEVLNNGLESSVVEVGNLLEK